MDCIFIECPHCHESYLAKLQNQTEECPVCKKPVTITITPARVTIS